MQEDRLYQQFKGNWLKRANRYFVSKESALDFENCLATKSIRTLGIDGFILDTNHIQPILEVMSDYSTGQPPRTVVRKLITASIGEVTHFSFVLDIESAAI